MSKAGGFLDLMENSSDNYRIMVKNSKGKFMPIEGIADGRPVFTKNVIYGLVLWSLEPGAAKTKFDEIRNKYPNLEFKFVKG